MGSHGDALGEAIGEASGAESPTEGLLGTLLDQAHYAVAAELPAIIHQAAARVGIREAVVYLADYGQTRLIPIDGEGVPRREPLAIDHTFGGRAYRASEALTSEQDEGDLRVWLPLLTGTARLGVLEARIDAFDPPTARRCRQLTALLATLVIVKDLYTDTFPIARRVESMSLAAEMQWSLLPPLTFSDGRVTVSGALEPSYRIAGDAFDYALNGPVAHAAIIDAMGHGFDAAVMVSVAVNVYRHARRRGASLRETYAAMSEAITAHFDGGFATAQLLRLDALTGTVQWVNAGHPPPVLLRGTHVVGSQECAPSLPLGLGGEVDEIGEISLQPGDRLLLMSDGVLEARSSAGEFFGDGPLPEFLTRALASGLPSAEVVRRLVRAVIEHHGGHLQDDATTVFLEWGGREHDDPFRAVPLA